MADAATGQVAATAAEVYERDFVPALFAPWAEPIVDAARVSLAHCVVDVGCGTGVAARAARRRAGDDGAVIGVDPNDGMLAVAARLAPDIDWRMGAAEALPVDDAVADAVIAQFSLMFLADPVAGAAEMARVLRSGGRLAAVTWADLDQNAGYSAMHALLDELFGAEIAEGVRVPFTVGDEDTLAGLLASSFPDVSVEREVRSATFPSIEAWVHTELRGWTASESIDDEMYARFLAEAEGRWSSFTDAAGRVSFPSPALIATAER
ncbi:MAG: methyltransferase domain-containing protein [Ilumatobacter sp.]|uniref:class I SAM-dependent methyltransferase n=1 Tax=Ilumatobacter sp. TaxID=1967498 RepID=UPI00262533B6|nr:methyltransferase domain-containing protein [Ilumatobacter sp.]MDJ0769275.1 methyltransferase domain-containing protein [Ilumatobacter sp.]